ncbi:MAG: ribonuclease Z [Actinomycetota bacterium]
MSARELIVLGTASQAPTRLRAHNGYVLRWDDQLILFDPGEGAQRQCLLAGVAVARLTAVCITHFHGDHCLGLPGIIQRRALDARSSGGSLPPLPVFHPGDGAVYLERMRGSSIYHDTSNLDPRPIEGPGPVAAIGGLELRADELDHRVTTFGYRLTEPDGIRLDPQRLSERGLAGPDVGRLVAQGWLDTSVGRVDLDEVSGPRPGQSMAFVMDTAVCPAIGRLADGVDLAVFESTYLEEHRQLAADYRHLTAGQAGRLAADAGVRRLLLSHFSARYPEPGVFAAEASAHHPDVVEASDLVTVEVPPRRP